MPHQPTLTRSSADAAFEAFAEFCGTVAALPRGAEWSEADTRAKLIDPMFIRVLGWSETEIQREAPVADGYVDYVLGVEFRHLHVEAKREVPRFTLNSPRKSRVLKLSGPHLLGNKQMRPHVEQAARYSFELGTDFSLLTNGHAYILIWTRPPGQSWRDGHAIVFHGLEGSDGIEGNFAEFYSLLARENVVAGSLTQAFTVAERLSVSLHRPLDLVRNPNEDLVRNPFWTRISRAVGPLLTDEPDDVALQQEIIEHCYVTTAASESVDKTITQLIKDDPSSWMEDAGVGAIRPSTKRDGFSHAVEDDIKNHRGRTYLLTGGVGSGKTTFLRRYSRVTNKGFVDQWCVWIHVDFLRIGEVTEAERPRAIASYFFRRCRMLLEQDYADLVPRDGEAMRVLFAPDLREAEKTILFGVEAAADRQRIENQIVHNLYTDDEKFVGALLRRPLGGRRVVFVLDNTDQLGVEFQESMFLFAQRICGEFTALTMVALREEKFFAAYRKGVFDAFGDRRFHIGSPSLRDVIRRRLYYALDKYRRNSLSEEPDDSQEVLRALIASTTGDNERIVEYLSCVSNGDMRYALGVFRDFISSGNTNVKKITRIIQDHGGYTVPFHEFAKSAILGSKKYFSSQSSHVVNLFIRSASTYSSHLTSLRLLSRLARALGASTIEGTGLVETATLLREYRQTFGLGEDIVAKGTELLVRGLLESDPPRCEDFARTNAVKASAAGYYYYRYLVRAFAYLDLVYVDTSVTSIELARELADLAPSVDFEQRFRRVRLFLDYLATEEERELTAVVGRDGPFSIPLIETIRSEIEDEIEEIQERALKYRY